MSIEDIDESDEIINKLREIGQCTDQVERFADLVSSVEEVIDELITRCYSGIVESLPKIGIYDIPSFAGIMDIKNCRIIINVSNMDIVSTIAHEMCHEYVYEKCFDRDFERCTKTYESFVRYNPEEGVCSFTGTYAISCAYMKGVDVRPINRMFGYIDMIYHTIRVGDCSEADIHISKAKMMMVDFVAAVKSIPCKCLTEYLGSICETLRKLGYI